MAQQSTSTSLVNRVIASATQIFVPSPMTLGAFGGAGLLFLWVDGDLDALSRRYTGDIDEQLSWQSALWAIAAIALTNMADLPSKVAGNPAELTFYVKSSPILCLCNVLASLVSIAQSVFAKGEMWTSGLDTALERISIDKFGLDGAEKIGQRPVRWTLFLFGALPQMIKLFACQGILSTQLIALCYILDFTVDELILLYAQIKARRSSQQTNGVTRINAYLSSLTTQDPMKPDLVLIKIGTALVPAWLIMNILELMWLLHFDGSEALRTTCQVGVSGSSAVILLFPICIPLLPIGWLKTDELRRRVRADMVLLSIVSSSTLLLYVYMLIEEQLDTDGMSIPRICVLVFIGRFGQDAYVDRFLKRPTEEEEGEVQKHYPYISIFLMSILNLIGFYTLQYNPYQSYRPSWIEWLG